MIQMENKMRKKKCDSMKIPPLDEGETTSLM